MAKKEQEKTDGTGRVKFRYADGERYFDLDVEAIKHEGGIVEGLKSIANALAGRTIAATANRVLPPKPPVTNEAPPPSPREDAQDPQEPVEVVEVSPATEGGDGRQRSRKKYVPKAPVLLNLDLSSAQVSLQEFAKQKNPESVNNKYIVVATWFKEQMKIDEISSDHIFTAFRTLDWQMPADPDSVFRTLKYKNQYFEKGEGKGVYKVTFPATNDVAKMGTKP
jgi:hypothetical protein